MNISFSIGNAKNYPVDLYFLMDLSWSMRSSRDKLISAGGDIIATIKNKTSDVNIGEELFWSLKGTVIDEITCVPSFLELQIYNGTL